MELKPERNRSLRSPYIFLWRKGSDGGFSVGYQQGSICPIGDPPDGHVKGGFENKV